MEPGDLNTNECVVQNYSLIQKWQRQSFLTAVLSCSKITYKNWSHYSWDEQKCSGNESPGGVFLTVPTAKRKFLQSWHFTSVSPYNKEWLLVKIKGISACGELSLIQRHVGRARPSHQCIIFRHLVLQHSNFFPPSSTSRCSILGSLPSGRHHRWCGGLCCRSRNPEGAGSL